MDVGRRYKNLIPDTPLHHHLETLLQEHGGRVPVELVCKEVLMMAAPAPALAVTLVQGLIEDHPHLRLDGNREVEWLEPTPEEVWASNRSFAVFDVETINGTRKAPRIIEIGICRVENGRIAEEWSSLVNPERSIPYWVRQLTGISDAEVLQAPRFPELLPQILTQLEDAILVAHHARFDVACLNGELRRALGLRLSNHYLCTVELARHFLPGSENYRLETLSQWLRLTHQRPHRAGPDARATAELLCHLLHTVEAPWSDYLRPRRLEIVETNPPPIS